MGSDHTVLEGEHLALIADRAGFCSIDPIVGHPKNAALFRDRQAGILAPEEIVFIPDSKPASLTIAAGARHPFRKRILRAKVRIVLQAFGGRAQDGLDCIVDCDGKETKITTAPDGLVEFPIPPSATEATVTITTPSGGRPDEEIKLKVDIGGVGHVSNEDSAILRLRNMGYFRPCFPEEDAAERKTAIEEFQLENGLKVTGELDDATASKLETVYGC